MKGLAEPRYGLYVPNFGKGSHPRTLADLAAEAEESGWDGFFLWDHLVEWNRRVPLCDSFTALTAIAMSTKRIRIGTTVSPLPRYKPWIVARKTASLDNLSNGRLILGVGLGGAESCDYGRFGESADYKILGQKLDESLEIITGLWKGKPFSYQGKHYRLGETTFIPKPKQSPRIPIWVGGFWPRKAPFRRAAKWDGIIPLKLPVQLLKPDDLTEILDYTRDQRQSSNPFDAAIIGWTVSKDPKKSAKKVKPYFDAGMTWWLESLYTKRDSPNDMRSRIRKGPPRIS